MIRRRSHADQFKAFSAVSFGELIYGCGRSDRPAENIAKVHHVAANFPVVPVSEPIMERYGPMKADLAKQGQMLEDFDLVIAATALHLGYTLVTETHATLTVSPACGSRTGWKHGLAVSEKM